MIYKYQYANDAERKALITNNATKRLLEEQNILEGNFLIFTDVPAEQTVLDSLQKENNLFKAQIKSNDARADFHEEILTEIIMTISQ